MLASTPARRRALACGSPCPWRERSSTSTLPRLRTSTRQQGTGSRSTTFRARAARPWTTSRRTRPPASGAARPRRSSTRRSRPPVSPDAARPSRWRMVRRTRAGRRPPRPSTWSRRPLRPPRSPRAPPRHRPPRSPRSPRPLHPRPPHHPHLPSRPRRNPHLPSRPRCNPHLPSRPLRPPRACQSSSLPRPRPHPRCCRFLPRPPRSRSLLRPRCLLLPRRADRSRQPLRRSPIRQVAPGVACSRSSPRCRPDVRR